MADPAPYSFSQQEEGSGGLGQGAGPQRTLPTLLLWRRRLWQQRGEGDIHHRNPTSLKEELTLLLLGQESNGGGGVGAGNSLEKGFWKILQLKAPLLAPLGRTPGSPPSSARNSPDPCSHVCQGPHRADGETRSQPGPDPAKPSAQCPGKASSSLGFRCVSCKQGKVLMIG